MNGSVYTADTSCVTPSQILVWSVLPSPVRLVVTGITAEDRAFSSVCVGTDRNNSTHKYSFPILLIIVSKPAELTGTPTTEAVLGKVHRALAQSADVLTRMTGLKSQMGHF